LTVAERISAEGHDEVAFVGTPGGLEARLASEAGLPFFPIRARGWDRAKPLSLLAAALVTSLSFVRSLYLLRRLRADVVVGFGGYVSLPLGLAAALASVPLVLHEQNSVPGVANRILSRWATAVCDTPPCARISCDRHWRSGQAFDHGGRREGGAQGSEAHQSAPRDARLRRQPGGAASE
jgi:UDP-N-acetylglucosamine--N-acetylmuramyl-(pentapeptide) pyrophosphoryl-undecaprenol N-acetylglucosamine transferase